MFCTTGMLFIAIILSIYYICLVITGQKEQYWNKISPVIKLVFSNLLKKPDSEGEEAKFIVFGYEASIKEMHWLILTLVQALLVAFAQFWDDFLFEVSGSCSADYILDCFYTTNSQLLYQNLNCSNTSQVKEATSIVCYKHVFNTGRAAASAVGIMSATGLTISAVCVVFLKVLDGARWPKCCIRIVKSVAIVEVIFFCIILGGLQAIFAARATDTFGIFNSFQKTLGMGFMIASSVLLLPMDKFRKSENKDENKPLIN